MDPAAERLQPLLDRMIDYERQRPTAREWNLDGIARLLGRASASVPARPALQIAGSKGKGTTAAFVDRLAASAGARVGSYSSPHLESMCERIRVGGENVPVDALEPILAALLDEAGSAAPTFFEAMTAAAVEWFARQNVDLAIYEAGLGGRFDATTAIDVDAAIVTHIEREHTEVLGDTVELIAGEKAPVIRPGGLGLTTATGTALDVIERHACTVDAELLVFGRDFGIREVAMSDGHASGVLWLPDGATHPFTLPRASTFELPALALAAAALQRLLPSLEPSFEPVSRPRLPCRFEVMQDRDGERIVLDGAHTEDSLAAVAREWRRRFGERRAQVLFAVATGKRWREGLRQLLSAADRFVVTELSGTPGEDPATIAAWLAEHGAQSEVATSAADALHLLRQHDGPRLVVGSFYLAGAIRQLVAESDGTTA